MRVLAFADQPPPADAAELVAANRPDVVVTLGDLERDWIASLASADVPKLGVRGNHDAEDELTALGIRDVHMECVPARSLMSSYGPVGSTPSSSARETRRRHRPSCRSLPDLLARMVWRCWRTPTCPVTQDGCDASSGHLGTGRASRGASDGSAGRRQYLPSRSISPGAPG